MGANRISSDEKQNISNNGKGNLNDIVAEYETLSALQVEERQELLKRIDELTQKTANSEERDAKLDQFTLLLLDIRDQIASITATSGDTSPPPITREILTKPEVVATNTEIQSLSEEVNERSTKLDDEISSLSHLLNKKKLEIDNKDLNIEELNDRLDMLGEEKQRLAVELEKMNTIIGSWKNQLQLLQQLASSDPRYRVIKTLKKHGDLSDIQLAFTMGTSINQLRKYIEDLVELKLIKKTSNGRYTLIGQSID